VTPTYGFGQTCESINPHKPTIFGTWDMLKGYSPPEDFLWGTGVFSIESSGKYIGT